MKKYKDIIKNWKVSNENGIDQVELLDEQGNVIDYLYIDSLVEDWLEKNEDKILK